MENGLETTRNDVKPQEATIHESRPLSVLWILYFYFTIALVGFFNAYLLTIPLKVLGTFSKKIDRLGDQCLRQGILFLLSLQPWLKANVSLEVPKMPCLMVSNHRSTLDVYFLHAYVARVQIVAKASLFRVPFLAIMMKVLKHIRIEKTPESYLSAMDEVVRRIKSGERVHVFPEMTRCDAGMPGIGKFRMLPFQRAFDAGIPVVPIAFVNTDMAWPKGKYGLRSGIYVRVCAFEPLDPRNFESTEALKEEVENVIRTYVMRHT